MSNPLISFPSTRAAAWAQLQEFLPRVPDYSLTRNRVEPGHAGVSRLSPAVTARLLTEDELLTETLSRYPAAKAEKWLQEICWRRYWKGWLEQHPKIWKLYVERLGWLRDNTHRVVLKRAEEVAAGRSGVALMDRFARELRETGYLHNHARMWWASFWVHVEGLPWELGAEFFAEQLLDSDAASNTLSWRWVAGLQTKGKPYLVRRTNLDRFCAPELLAESAGLGRLADGAVEAWVPDFPEVDPKAEGEIDWAERETGAYATYERFASYPSRPPELGERHGLWIHPEDVTPELGNLGVLRPVATAAVITLGGSALQADFRRALLADATGRAARHFGSPAEVLDSPKLADGVVTWARRNALATVCAMAPGVGPVADELPAIRAALSEVGTELLLFRRFTDFELWPHAREGYFKFWEAAEVWIRAKQKRGELPKAA